MSKKILAFILAACMTISMVACGSSEDSVSEKNSSSDSSTVDESTSEDDSASDNSESENEKSDSEKDTSKDDSSVAETSKKVTETSKVTETPKPTKKVTETPKTTQAPTVTPKVTEAPKATTSTSKPSHTHNWKPVYYTKYANYQATTDGGSFVSKTYYFRNENGDLASKQDRINYNKACEECEDYIGSPQNKSAGSYAEISKPFGPSNKVYFYYCVNGSNIEVTFDPNSNEVYNFYTSFSGTLVNDVKNGGVWVKGTIFENM